MEERSPLTAEQEELRQDGLRILARIIARHYAAHPEIYEGADGAQLDGGRDGAGCEDDPDIGRPAGEGRGS